MLGKRFEPTEIARVQGRSPEFMYVRIVGWNGFSKKYIVTDVKPRYPNKEPATFPAAEEHLNKVQKTKQVSLLLKS